MAQQNEGAEKLQVGKDYIGVDDNNFIVIDRTGDIENRGFYDDLYKKHLNCSNHSEWREATESEVIEAFEKHLNHRFGEDWKTMKIKEKHPSSQLARPVNNNSYRVAISKYYDGWAVWNKNGLLYCNGIWVERLEDIEAMNQKEKSDKKRYEVIKTTFSDFKQISLGDNKTNKVIAHFVNQDEEILLLAEKIVGILNLMEK